MIFMINKKIYKRTLLIKIRQSLESLKGVKDFHIKDYIFDEYNDMQVLINSFYKYNAQGEKVEVISENGSFKNKECNAILKIYMDKYLDYEKEYYITYENIYFLVFRFSEFLAFIESWRDFYHTYDLTLLIRTKCLSLTTMNMILLYIIRNYSYFIIYKD